MRKVLRIAKQAAAGLAEAHAQGLVHRDVKPANILLSDGVERGKLTDFGLPRAADDASLTKTGVIAGTPQYMSPEQVRGDSVDQRSDLFSLGSVMYTMCSGRPPFRAETSYGIHSGGAPSCTDAAGVRSDRGDRCRFSYRFFDIRVRRSFIIAHMTEVTRLITAISDGEQGATDQLLPVVYDELRQLAVQKLSQEKPGQTLQATALVHEAYLRLVGSKTQDWDNHGHFFAAAAEAMRRILIDNARRKQRVKHGGGRQRLEVDLVQPAADVTADELIAMDQALENLSAEDKVKADLVRLRYFAGLTVEQAAQALGISRATAHRYWVYARAWLHDEVSRVSGESNH